MALGFSNVPSGAKVTPNPFQVHISDDQIEELQLLVKLSKVAPPTYEGLQQDRRYGISNEWLATAKEAWKNFDWCDLLLPIFADQANQCRRSAEDHINSWPQFTYDIEGMTIHFVALFSKRKDAIPIVLIHGWPGKLI